MAAAAVVVAAALVVVAVVVGYPAARGASASPPVVQDVDPVAGWFASPPWGETPWDLLDRARDAVGGISFRGEVEVRWRDGRGLRQVRIPVVDDAGVLWVGDGRAVGAGPVRMLRAPDGGWEELWNGDAHAGRDPRAAAKYRLRAAGRAVVAGRATTLVEVVAIADSAVCERVFLDEATGLVLRRDEIGGAGEVVRSVRFREISGLEPVGDVRAVLPRPERSRAPILRVDAVPAPYHAPGRAGHGFVLVDRFRHPDGGVQLFYSDGVFSLSVFEQRGSLERSALPPGGPPIEGTGRRARTYRWAGGTTVVWEASGVVYTCVTDAPASEIGPMLASFPSTAGRGAWDRITDLVLRPFRWA